MAMGFSLKGRGRALALALGVFVVGMAAGAGMTLFYGDAGEPQGGQPVEVRSEGYVYTRPLLECEIHSGQAVTREIRSFRNEVQALVDDSLGKGLASEISLYYRDLNNGPWFAVNPESRFVPASLMKVPMMMSLFRMAEKDPGLLKMETRIDPGFPSDWGQTYPPAQKLQVGQIYSVEELIRRMIVYSDNGATSLLNTFVPNGQDEQLWKDLGFSLVKKDGRRDWVSVENYASFFRILYNSSYLSRDFSERALSLLSETTFPGIKSGVPKGVDVAEKFGHFEMPGEAGKEQLHSCGIVYQEDHPYLLCVMTRGNNLKAQERVITSLSSAVYGFVSSPGFRLH